MSIEDELYEQRLAKISQIEALGFKAYGHRFDFTHSIPKISAEYSDKTAEELENHRVNVRVKFFRETARCLMRDWAADRFIARF